MRWLAGDRSRRADLEEAVARVERGDGVAWLRLRDRRRRLARVALRNGRSCAAKHYLGSDRHAWREWWKRRLHLSAAEREWRTLVRLRAAGVPVPAPLAHVELASGQHVVVTEWIDGVPLADALAPPAARRKLLAAVGALVRALHRAGWVHRDLHRENILVADGAPVLIDLQAAQRRRSAAARQRDVGRLDDSLRGLLPLSDRVRLRAAALGLERPFGAAGRAQLRAVGRASRAAARAHAHSRAVRSLRAGRHAERFAAAGGRGLVSRAFDAAAVRAALGASDRGAPPGLELRRYAARASDLWRGSAARRAWVVAHALDACGIACAAPVAFVEWSRCGVPVRSALVVADAPREPACAAAVRAEAEAAVRARMLEAGFAIAELGPDGLALFERGGRIVAQVVALERVRFRVRRWRVGPDTQRATSR